MTQGVICPRCNDWTVVAGERFCGRCGADVWSNTQELNIEALRERSLLESLRRATLGDYEIREELGRGGMATVYLAHDLRLNKKVALKVLAPHLQLMPGMPARFLREAQTAAGMDHPNIIPIYAYRETADLAYFTMRYVDGASLSAVVKQVGQFPVATVRALLWDIGGALAFAHTHGVLHRDVKPGNVLLGRDGSVIVTDFGIAKQMEGQSLTLTGQVLGTPAYMSPEQCREKNLTFASDQYSLGVMAFELLAGRVPFTSEGAGELMAQHLMEPPPHVMLFRPDCPRELADAVMRMLEKDPLARFPAIEDALVSARAMPVLPSDSARMQLRNWAQHPAHARSLANTPVSPMIGSPQSTPEREAPESALQAMAVPVSEPPTPEPAVPALELGTPELVTPDVLETPAPVTPAQALSPYTPPPMRAHASAPTTPRNRVLPLTLGALGAIAALLVIVKFLRTPDSPSPTARPQALPPSPTAPSTIASGMLQVSQLPPDGTAYVDGRRVDGTGVELTVGEHRLRLEAPGYVVADTTVKVAASDTARIVFAAQKIERALPAPIGGTLTVTGLPTGGSIRVDGRPASGSRIELKQGKHTIRMLAPGYEPVETIVQISAGATPTLTFQSKRVAATQPQPAALPAPQPVGRGVLMLRVDPFAQVFVDGVFAVEDELHVATLSEGRHVLRFVKPGFATLDTAVVVPRADTIKQSYTLKPRTP